MSPWASHLRRRLDPGEGFTLIELIVSLTLLALVAAGVFPLFIVGAKAANAAKLHTQAKNLAQQRLESMRNLQFHVDRQNGPFIDLLDVYYTDLSTSATTRTRGAETMVGQWVASGATNPEPTGPFYRVRVAQVPGYPQFSQTIDTQFLSASGSVIPSSSFANYNSQVEGVDQPPTLLAGVTVITSWSDHGKAKSYVNYTRIADGRGMAASMTSQGRGEFLRLTSAGPSGNALTVDVALAEADGSQSTGSTASASAKAVDAVDAAGTDYAGASGVATSPGNGGSTTASVNALAADPYCNWIGFGRSQVGNVTADTTNGGLPKVPSTVDTASPPANQTTAQLMANSGGSCGVLSFSNQSTSYEGDLRLQTSTPLVRIVDDASQNNAIVTGSAWVNASDASTTPHTVSSGANASGTKAVQVFPGLPFVTDGRGLVDVKLTSASISCLSSVASGAGITQTSSGSWQVTVDYWKATDTVGGGTRVSNTYTWSSSTGSGTADPLASVPLSTVVWQNGTEARRLSDYIASWNTARNVTESPTSGVHQLNGVVSVATQPVRDGDPNSSIGVQVGNLSCVADDQR